MPSGQSACKDQAEAPWTTLAEEKLDKQSNRQADQGPRQHPTGHHSIVSSLQACTPSRETSAHNNRTQQAMHAVGAHQVQSLQGHSIWALLPCAYDARQMANWWGTTTVHSSGHKQTPVTWHACARERSVWTISNGLSLVAIPAPFDQTLPWQAALCAKAWQLGGNQTCPDKSQQYTSKR